MTKTLDFFKLSRADKFLRVANYNPDQKTLVLYPSEIVKLPILLKKIKIKPQQLK